MIDNIKITNSRTNASITMTKSFGSNYIIENIDWNAVDATHNKYSNLTGIGDTITSTKLSSRTIAITGRVCSARTIKEIMKAYGVATLEEVNNKRIEEIDKAKKALSQLINPMHYLKLFAGTLYIDGKPDSSVAFSSKEAENNEIYCKFTFSMTCSDPLFYTNLSKKIPLTATFGGFHFPLQIRKPNGMHFGEKTSYQLVVVNNSGDLELGGLIVLKAKGVVINPSLTNPYEEKSIHINKTLQKGEIIRIDTTNRKIVGSTDGVTYTNYFGYWDFDNDWLQFGVGNTLIGFSAESETHMNLEMYIELREQYYSMEEQ